MTAVRGETMVFGKKVGTTRILDPELGGSQGIAETEHVEMDPYELDRLRAEAQGHKYVSPQEAAKEEQQRPMKAENEARSIGREIRDGLREIAGVGRADAAAERTHAALPSKVGFVDPLDGPPPPKKPVEIDTGDLEKPRK